jgi:hypothetical protein
MRLQGKLLLLTVLLTVLAAPALLPAQAPPPQQPPGVPEGYEVRWHIVRPGETLRGITTRYLGSPARWQDNHRLNPHIADPDQLRPGQRIRILLPRRGAPPAAQVRKLSRRVEERPSPVPWSEARIDDLLLERDGLRTHARSSAEMEFTDGTRLQITEDSLVFLSRTGRTLRGVDRNSVEIVQGQADLDARPVSGRPAPEVEIVLGGVRATAKPGPSGSSQSRARRADGGGAKLMVYGGAGEVEAGGARVAVPEGMGTSVAKEGPPSPPEKLLAAPRLLAPAAGVEVACSNPPLSWVSVPEADSYTIEVCRDAACGALVERLAGYTGAEWRPAALPLGDLYWRVTARAGSGLDGYPSEAARLSITSEQPDLDPPAGTFEIAGRRVAVGDRLIVAPDASLKAVVEDAGSGPGAWVPVVDGAEQGAGRWSAGPRSVGAAVADRCGNRASLAPVALVVDGAPPTLRWQVGTAQEFEERGEPEGWERERPRRRGRSRREEPASTASPLAWSAGGLGWLPFRAGDDGAVRLTSEKPQLFLRGDGIALGTGDGATLRLGAGDVLWIQVEDDAAGVESFTVRLRPQEGSPAGGTLELEVTDMVGNARRGLSADESLDLTQETFLGPPIPKPSPASGPPPATPWIKPMPNA